MTHNEWEKGKRLTVHNATKDQLKFMVEDRDATIKRLWKELNAEKKKLEMVLKFPDCKESEKVQKLLGILANYGGMIKRNNGMYPSVVLDDISKSIEFVLREWGFEE